MKNKKISSMLLVLVVALLLVPGASAWENYLSSFETTYPAAVGSRIDRCGVCHINPNSGGARNVYGLDFAANGYSFAAIESKDSDLDGFVNIDEINALTFPGNINDKPAIAPVLTSVTISPLTPTVQIPNTLQFLATALDQNGASIGAAVTWESSNAAAGTINTNGMFTVVGAGTSTITVTAVNGSVTKTNSTTVTVTPATQPKVLTTVTISPTNPTVVEGSTRLFSATPLDQNNAPIGASLTWASSDTANGTINNTTGLFTAVRQGTTTITVTAINGSTTVTNRTVVTVEAPGQGQLLKNITVLPKSQKIVVGKSRTFFARTLDQFNKAISVIVTWASSNTSVGTIESNGKFTALSEGTTTITATNGTISGSASVIVKASRNTTEDDEHEEDEHEEDHYKGQKQGDKHEIEEDEDDLEED